MDESTEKKHRTYYQELVYKICNLINKRLQGGTVVGSFKYPDDSNLIERLEELLQSHTLQEPTVNTTIEGLDNTANDQQVDGNHYQTEIQPWDFIEANKLTFIEGNIVKYVARHRKKNGVRDLMKAKHYLEKLIEIEQSKPLGDSDVTEN